MDLSELTTGLVRELRSHFADDSKDTFLVWGPVVLDYFRQVMKPVGDLRESGDATQRSGGVAVHDSKGACALAVRYSWWPRARDHKKGAKWLLRQRAGQTVLVTSAASDEDTRVNELARLCELICREWQQGNEEVLVIQFQPAARKPQDGRQVVANCAVCTLLLKSWHR
jgi:hypothetical protein